MGFEGFDASQIDHLGLDLVGASFDIAREAAPILERGALGVKNVMVREAQSSGHYQHFSRSISYEETAPGQYEIGPDKDRGGTQAALGNILYFGTSKSGPVLDIESGIREEEPKLRDHLSDLAARKAAGRG